MSRLQLSVSTTTTLTKMDHFCHIFDATVTKWKGDIEKALKSMWKRNCIDYTPDLNYYNYMHFYVIKGDSQAAISPCIHDGFARSISCFMWSCTSYYCSCGVILFLFDFPTYWIVGDNCNLHQILNHETLTRCTQEHHLFYMYAVKDCVQGLEMANHKLMSPKCYILHFCLVRMTAKHFSKILSLWLLEFLWSTYHGFAHKASSSWLYSSQIH